MQKTRFERKMSLLLRDRHFGNFGRPTLAGAIPELRFDSFRPIFHKKENLLKNQFRNAGTSQLEKESEFSSFMKNPFLANKRLDKAQKK